jgi:hypothetical protein
LDRRRQIPFLPDPLQKLRIVGNRYRIQRQGFYDC